LLPACLSAPFRRRKTGTLDGMAEDQFSSILLGEYGRTEGKLIQV
jgi:hypothetical protein